MCVCGGGGGGGGEGGSGRVGIHPVKEHHVGVAGVEGQHDASHIPAQPHQRPPQQLLLTHHASQLALAEHLPNLLCCGCTGRGSGGRDSEGSAVTFQTTCMLLCHWLEAVAVRCVRLTGHGSDEGGKLLLILPQLHHQQSAQGRVEGGPAPSVQVAMGYTQKWEVLRLPWQQEREGRDKLRQRATVRQAAYRVVLQDELDGVEFDQLPDTAVAHREVVQQLHRLAHYHVAAGPALEVGDSASVHAVLVVSTQAIVAQHTCINLQPQWLRNVRRGRWRLDIV